MRNEKGAALLQVIFVGVLVAIFAYTGMQMLSNADKNNLRIVRRNQNITYSILLSDQVSDKNLVKDLATVPLKDASGTDVKYW